MVNKLLLLPRNMVTAGSEAHVTTRNNSGASFMAEAEVINLSSFIFQIAGGAGRRGKLICPIYGTQGALDGRSQSSGRIYMPAKFRLSVAAQGCQPEVKRGDVLSSQPVTADR